MEFNFAFRGLKYKFISLLLYQYNGKITRTIIIYIIYLYIIFKNCKSTGNI